MPLDDILEVILKVFEDNILNQFSLFVLRIEQVLDLNDVWTIFQYIKHLILTTHPLANLLYSL